MVLPSPTPALDDIQKAQKAPEKLHFSLLEKLALQVRAGGDIESHIGGARAYVRISSPTVRRDSKGDPVIAARIEVNVLSAPHALCASPTYIKVGTLKALVELRPGQLLIGQSNLSAGAAGGRTPQSHVYHLIRASLCMRVQ